MKWQPNTFYRAGHILAPTTEIVDGRVCPVPGAVRVRCLFDHVSGNTEPCWPAVIGETVMVMWERIA